MKFTLHILTVAAALFFTACSQKEEASSVPVPQETIQETTQEAGSALFLTDSPSVGAVTTGNQVQTTGTGQTSAAGGALNPPHGQPGHRCEIAVGAPLNSPAGTGMNPNQQTMPVPQQITTQQSGATVGQPVNLNPQKPASQPIDPTATGPNPAHGEPGHRCDIAVGAPLNSPAGTGMTPPSNTQALPNITMPSTTPSQVPDIKIEPVEPPK